MRILLLLNGRFPTEKAYGIQTLAMAQGFASAGSEVGVAFPRLTDVPPPSTKGVVFLPFGPRLKLYWPWLFHFFRPLGVYTALSAIHAFKPDMIIANDPFQAAFLSRRFPVAWDLHDIPNVRRIGRRWLIRKIARQSKAIISTNALKLEAIRPIVGTLPPMIVLPNPVSTDPSVYRAIGKTSARERLGIRLEAKIVVYAGQLYDWKGVDTLISSAAFMPHDVQLHIVGGLGADLERCRQLAAGLPSTGATVVFHGMKPSEEIPYWLRAADVVAIPNSGKFEVSRRDTNPLKLYEALAAEAPVLASDLPSIREAVGMSEAVRFVTPDDPSAWGASIAGLFSEPDCLEHMGRAARAFDGVLLPHDRARKLLEFFASRTTAR